MLRKKKEYSSFVKETMILNWRNYHSNKFFRLFSLCTPYPIFRKQKCQSDQSSDRFSCCSQFPSNDQIVFMTSRCSAFESLQIQFLSSIPLARYSNLPAAQQYSHAIASLILVYRYWRSKQDHMTI